MNVISGTQAKELVAQQNAQLVDVRTPGEFAQGHPSEAVNIPLQELAARLRELDPSRPVVVYCRSGMRSAQAAQMLAHSAFVVYDMGSVMAW